MAETCEDDKSFAESVELDVVAEAVSQADSSSVDQREEIGWTGGSGSADFAWCDDEVDPVRSRHVGVVSLCFDDDDNAKRDAGEREGEGESGYVR